MGCKLKNNKTDIMPIKDDILQNINNNFEFVCKIDTNNIQLYSTDPYFYKKSFIQWYLYRCIQKYKR